MAKAAASVEGIERMRWRREIEGIAGRVGRAKRARTVERELEQLRREKQQAVVDEGRRPDAPTWARIRAAWAAEAQPGAWRTWLEPLRFVSSEPGERGELVLELEAASEQALEVAEHQLEQLQDLAAAALAGRRVQLRLSVAGRPSS